MEAVQKLDKNVRLVAPAVERNGYDNSYSHLSCVSLFIFNQE